MILDLKEWLDDLVHGKSPLLTVLQGTFIEDIFKIAIREVMPRKKCASGNDNITNEKLCIVEANLVQVVERLRQCLRHKKKFVQQYPKWHEIRAKNVEMLMGVGNSMHSVKRDCNVSRLVGNCTSLVGGGVCIASAVSIPFTLGLITPLAVLGGTLTALGSATSVGTSITELVLLKKKIEEATAILERDKKSLQELQEWLEHANELLKAIEAISSVTLGEAAMTTMRQLMAVAVSAHGSKAKYEYLTKFVRFTVQDLKLSPCTDVLRVALIVGLLAIIMLLCNYYDHMLDDASQTMSVITGFAPLVGISADIALIASTVIKTDIKIASDVGKAVTRGAVAVFGMSLDVASIILTSIDIHKGSLCQKGEDIIQIASKLEEEAKFLEKVFHELIKNRDELIIL